MPQGLKILGSIDKVGAENLRAGRDVRAGPKFEGEHAPPLCFQWGFTRTCPRNQDATVKLKSELISIKFK